MTEKLIVGSASMKFTSGDARKYTSRARLSSVDFRGPESPDFTETSTEIGRLLAAALLAVDGIEIRWLNRHDVVITLVHPELWSWDEVELGIIAAWAQVLGGEPEIIREGL